jgi:hypothetical protein
VIHSLNPASEPEASKTASPKPQAAKAGGGVAPFAQLHADAVRKHKDVAAASTSPKRERLSVPKDETWEVTKPGAHYARIADGPRKGLYINLTHGSRRGMTFKIEERHGNVFHVYTKTGQEILVKPAADAAAVTDGLKHRKTPHDQPHKGEKWQKVSANYADIIGGPRNGLYVNTSGGARDGMAFQVVKKGGKWWHVYGTGKDRQWIPSDGPKHKVDHSGKGSSASSSHSSGGTAPATGGTAPASSA